MCSMRVLYFKICRVGINAPFKVPPDRDQMWIKRLISVVFGSFRHPSVASSIFISTEKYPYDTRLLTGISNDLFLKDVK